MSPSIVLDPSTFCILSEARDENHAIVLLKRLISWLKRPHAEIPRVLIDNGAISRMREQGLVPLFPHIQASLRQFNLEFVVSAAELSGYIEKYLSNAPDFGSAAFVRDVLVEDAAMNPDEFQTITKSNLREISYECAWLAGVNQAAGMSTIYGFPLMEKEKVIVDIRASLILSQPPEAIERLGDSIDANIIFLQDHSAAQENLNALDIWQHASDADEIDLAIRVSTLQNGGSARNLNFTVGSSFLNSLHANGAIRGGPFASAVMNKCTQILLKAENISVSEFRVSADQSSAVRRRSRDNARALRTHISKEHQALRLMFWEMQDGKIEFANIGPKHELNIDEGT